MFVDESGLNCILVSDTELFYNHWDSDFIYRIDVFTPDHFKVREGETINNMVIKSIDIKVIEDPLFEIVLGTKDGQILHGCYMAQPREGTCTIIEKFDTLITIDEQETIEDIKIVKLKEFISIVAVS